MTRPKTNCITMTSMSLQGNSTLFPIPFYLLSASSIPSGGLECRGPVLSDNMGGVHVEEAPQTFWHCDTTLLSAKFMQLS